ncbi:MAG: glycerate kinase [Candidatus Hydrogenedentes bacterium]|nr:glycerate kinase [Candidatus Hydrogenedentota bacterium]
MRRILVLPDSFKESLDSVSVCNAIRDGVRKVFPDFEIDTCPLSDGGEGFLESASHYLKLKKVRVEVTDLTGKLRKVCYGWCPDKKLAIIETAKIVGLHLVPKERRKPEYFTSYGVGEVIMEAINRGANEIVVGLGGSGVNDGGAGIAQALGYKLIDKNGKEIEWGPLGLMKLKDIIVSPHKSLLERVSIYIASDVRNPFYGRLGATYVYGPQKGLTKEMCPKVDFALRRFAGIIKRVVKADVQQQPGSGSAGGMGGALFAFANGKFVSGFEWIRKVANLDEKIEKSDLIITGEGQLDYQSSFGKLVGEVVKLAGFYKKKVVILVGRLGEGWEKCVRSFDVAVFPISAGEFCKEELLDNSYKNLARTSEQVCKLLDWFF